MATVIDGTSGSSIAGAGSVVGNLSVGGDLTVTGSITAGSGTVYNLEQYTSPATWTKPTGLKAVKVTVVGAGGDGGAYSSTGSTNDAGAGGGAGGATIDYIPAPSITSPTPGPVTVAITAGPGTNSFGGFCSATAGSAGSGFPGSGQGGVGGIGTGGSVNCNGAAAENVYATKGTNGAASILGGGAQAVFRTTAGVTPGVAGVSYGSGGSGAQKVTPSSATGLGGTGAPGIVIVEEFY